MVFNWLLPAVGAGTSLLRITLFLLLLILLFFLLSPSSTSKLQSEVRQYLENHIADGSPLAAFYCFFFLQLSYF